MASLILFCITRQRGNFGAYIQDQIMLGDQWILTAGIRFDQYQIVNTYTEANVNPKCRRI